MILRRALVALGIPAVACSSPAPTRRSAPTTAVPAPSPGTADSRPDDVVPPTTSPAPATSNTEEAPATTAYVVTIPTDPPTTTTVRPRPLPTTTLPERTGDALTDAEWWAKQPGFVPGACGGTLPPCWVMQRESGGNIRAVNPSSGAAGKWQFLPSTSRALGYSRPMNEYDEATQDTAASTLWDGGRGCSHWGAC